MATAAREEDTWAARISKFNRGKAVQEGEFRYAISCDRGHPPVGHRALPPAESVRASVSLNQNGYGPFLFPFLLLIVILVVTIVILIVAVDHVIVVIDI